jgi:hypothetical protein
MRNAWIADDEGFRKMLRTQKRVLNIQRRLSYAQERVVYTLVFSQPRMAWSTEHDR